MNHFINGFLDEIRKIAEEDSDIGEKPRVKGRKRTVGDNRGKPDPLTIHLGPMVDTDEVGDGTTSDGDNFLGNRMYMGKRQGAAGRSWKGEGFFGDTFWRGNKNSGY